MDEALAVLSDVASKPENRHTSRWRVIRLAAEQLYPAVHGPSDYATALANIRTETDKKCLSARIEALHRRLDREQAAIDYQYMVACEDAYECCTGLEEVFEDEVYTYNDVTRYDELTGDAFRLWQVLPQGFHPSVVQRWGIKVTR